MLFVQKHCQRHNGPRILSPTLELSRKTETKANSNSALLAFLHSLVNTFPTLCTSQPSFSPTTISMTTVTSQWSNNIYCRQHDYSSPAHQLQYSVQLLYHHLADPLGDLQAHIGLDHHLNDNQQPQITLLASASIELVSSSARITSVKFQKALGVTPGPIDRTPETPGSGKNMKNHPLFHSATFPLSYFFTCPTFSPGPFSTI